MADDTTVIQADLGYIEQQAEDIKAQSAGILGITLTMSGGSVVSKLEALSKKLEQMDTAQQDIITNIHSKLLSIEDNLDKAGN